MPRGNIKVKVSNVNEQDLERTRQIMVGKARSIFQARPFLTKLYMSMHYGFTMEFLKANWNEITKIK